MKTNNFLNDLFKGLMSLNDDIVKMYKLYEDEFDAVLSDSLDGKHKAIYTYDNLENDERKKIVVDKMNFWSKIASRFYNSEYMITFKFGNDEYYFEWDKDKKQFVTTEPNGDKYIYNENGENLILLEKTEDKNDVNASGVNSDVVDNTAIEKDKSELKNDNSDKGKLPESEFSDIEPDKNLAFNLRNKLNMMRENNEESCDDCDYKFCPKEACSNFKEYILDYGDFKTDYDEYGNAYQISFGLDDLAVVNYDIGDEDFKILDEIYHKESQNLDYFCELMKESYGFSLGSWTVTFDNDDNKKVVDIRFMFTF